MTKILIVEDEIIIANDIQHALERLGYTVPAIAVSGEGAIEKTAAIQPDLVLMDIGLKGEIDGIKAAAQIHSRFDIPIVYLTAYADAVTLQRAKITEPFGYIFKPFGEGELHSTIEMALYKHSIESRLRESEERFRRLAENAKDMIYRQSLPDGRYEYISPASIELLGYTPEEICSEPMYIRQVIHPDWAAYLEEQWERMLRGDMPPSYEYQIIHKSGEARWLYQRNVLISDDNGRPVAIEGIVTDITERVRAEEALRESEARYRSMYAMFRLMADNMPDLLWAKDVDSRFLFANQALCDKLLLARDTDEPVGKNDMFFASRARQAHPDDPEWYTFGEICVDSDSVVMSTRQPERFDEFGNVQGEFLYLDVYKAPIWNEQGEMVGTVGCGRVMTREKQIEQELRESEEYARNIIESSLDMIITCDMNRHIVEFNKAAQEAFGYHRDKVIGKHVDMLYADPQESLTLHETAIREGKCVQEILNRRKNGEVFPAFLSASVLCDTSGETIGVMGISRDITERVRAEEALRWRNRELAMLNRASQALVSTLDLDQVLVNILEKVRDLLNVTATSIWLLEDSSRREGQGESLVCQQVIGPQSELVRGWRLTPGQGFAGLVARSGQSLIVPDVRVDERHFKGVDQQTGLELRSILTIPLRIKSGVIGVLQVVDTTVGRFSEADLELLEPLAASAAIALENARLYEQARQDAETRAVLLREVNHRVKNNLTGIMGLLYAARNRAQVDDRATYRATMDELIGRVRGLAAVHDLLSASGWAALRLSDLVFQVIETSLKALSDDKHVSVEVSPSPVRVTADEAHNLALVINELAINSAKYALEGRDAARIACHITHDGDRIRCEFRDDGPGYPEEVLKLEYHNVGFDMIQNITRSNLGGELSLYNDNGAVAVIQF